MVFFTCNHCGESLKKQAVEKHGFRCKRGEINVSCMDCQKDFHGKAYDAHTSCITEAEKYSGKDYVPKANANKGAKKQEAWLDTIRAITSSKKDLSAGVNNVFNVISKNDNIPRKQKGFMNFFANSAKHIRKHDVEAAWTLLEEEVKKNQQQQQQNNNQQKQANGQNETSAESNGVGKRKLEEEEPETAAAAEEPVKKKAKKKDKQLMNGKSEEHEQLIDNAGNEENGGAAAEDGKFKWGEVIREVLSAKNNEMKLLKLKKKVLQKYRKIVGCEEVSDKIERKFGKKLTKLGLVVENDTVRLID